jgi:hypothetical protein
MRRGGVEINEKYEKLVKGRKKKDEEKFKLMMMMLIREM